MVSEIEQFLKEGIKNKKQAVNNLAVPDLKKGGSCKDS